MLTVTDLSTSHELDRAAMSVVRGGIFNLSTPTEK